MDIGRRRTIWMFGVLFSKELGKQIAERIMGDGQSDVLAFL